MAKRKRHAKQTSMWVAISDLPRSAAHPFYTRLNQILDTHDFDGYVEALCEPFYAGRPARAAARALLPVAADWLLRTLGRGARHCLASGLSPVSRVTPSGIDTPTRADLARIDRKRKKKGSNDDWTHPHDPDAKITKMKDGRTHLAHKAEHAIDLETARSSASRCKARTRAIRRRLNRRCPRPPSNSRPWPRS